MCPETKAECSSTAKIDHFVVEVSTQRPEPKTFDPKHGAPKSQAETAYFLVALAADLVTLPEPAAAFSTDLMTPTATVWRMSRTAKRPRGG